MPEIVYQRYVANAYKPQAGKTVDYNSANAKPGKALTIYYQGNLANADEVKLHWGYNNWQQVNDRLMVKRNDGFWETTISVPQDVKLLNFAFTDGVNWDNNSSTNSNETVVSSQT